MHAALGELANQEGDAVRGWLVRTPLLLQAANQIFVLLGGGGNVTNRRRGSRGLESSTHKLEQQAKSSRSTELSPNGVQERLEMRDDCEDFVHGDN